MDVHRAHHLIVNKPWPRRLANSAVVLWGATRDCLDAPAAFGAGHLATGRQAREIPCWSLLGSGQLGAGLGRKTGQAPGTDRGCRAQPPNGSRAVFESGSLNNCHAPMLQGRWMLSLALVGRWWDETAGSKKWLRRSTLFCFKGIRGSWVAGVRCSDVLANGRRHEDLGALSANGTMHG